MIKMENYSLRRVFLSLVILIYMITSSLTVYVFYLNSQKLRKDYVGRYAIAQSNLDKNNINAIIEKELVISRKFADDIDIKNWILNEKNPSITKKADEQLKNYKKYFSSGIHFIGIKSSRNYYLNTVFKPDNKLDQNNPGDRWFFDAIQNGKEYSLNVNYDSVLNDIKLWMNVLVKDQNGQCIGVAGSGMDITRFIKSIVSHNKKGINTIIINSKGEIQAHPNEEIVYHNARVTKDEDKTTIYQLLTSDQDRNAIKKGINALQKKNDVQLFYLNYNNKEVLGAINYLPDLDWYNIVLVDSDQVISYKEFLPFIILFILTISLILVMTYFLFSQLISKPLTRFAHTTESIAEGNYSIQLTVAGKNEIALLSGSFNKMTSEIKKYTENLEELVNLRTDELFKANKALEFSQKRIFDSIHYAKLIQNSILPTNQEMKIAFPNHFIWDNPLDIVGGDFYFLRETRDRIYFAVIDCTGHGVPGAFMTILVNSVLNNIIDQQPDLSLKELIQQLHHTVQDRLKVRDNYQHLDNGFDISMVCHIKHQNILHFTGAGLPLLMIHNSVISEIKGDAIHPGYFSTKRDLDLTEHEIPFDDQTRFILFTDGLLDIPVGPEGFGLGRKQLTQLIMQTCKQSVIQSGEEFILTLKDINTKPFKDDILLFMFELKERNENG